MTNDEKLIALIGDKTLSDARKRSLTLAIEAGASDKVLETIRDAGRVSRKATIVLPPGRYENLSRGKGWCRKGKGTTAVWGERVDGGYEVGAGRWVVGSNDGFSRKGEVVWSVKHLDVCGQIWTVAD